MSALVPSEVPYHQVLRTTTHRWWKPVLGMVLSLIGVVVVAPIVLFPVLVVGAALMPGGFMDNLDQAFDLSDITPLSLLYLNLGLASMIPISFLVVRWVHGVPPRWLSSVRPRLRWRWMGACTGAAVLTMAVVLGASLLLPGEDLAPGSPGDSGSSKLAFALVLLFTTPLQSTGEEYLFRGYLLQALGSLGRSQWFAVLASSLVFALAHGSQNLPLFFDRFAFGLVAGLTVVLTGGLEAGIAMHVLNNLLALGVALAYGDLGETLTISEASWWNIPLTLLQSGLYLGLVVWMARRRQLPRTTPALPG